MDINIVASFSGKHEGLLGLRAPFKVESWPDRSGVSIELMDGAAASFIDQAITNFVSSLHSAVVEVPAGGELRMAAYFKPDEAACLVISLPDKVVKLLADAGLALEIACFPCSS